MPRLAVGCGDQDGQGQVGLGPTKCRSESAVFNQRKGCRNCSRLWGDVGENMAQRSIAIRKGPIVSCPMLGCV